MEQNHILRKNECRFSKQNTTQQTSAVACSAANNVWGPPRASFQKGRIEQKKNTCGRLPAVNMGWGHQSI